MMAGDQEWEEYADLFEEEIPDVIVEIREIAGGTLLSPDGTRRTLVLGGFITGGRIGQAFIDQAGEQPASRITYVLADNLSPVDAARRIASALKVDLREGHA